MSNTAALTQQVRERTLASGFDAETAEALIANLTAEQMEQALQNWDAEDAERAELRDRLMADPLLRRAVCPTTSWADADARFEVARRALRIAEATAEKNGVELEALCEQLASDHGTVQDTIDLHGDDPRFDGTRRGFHAFRFRLRDALDVLLAEQRAEARRAEMARQEARWEAQGLVRCDRCGGAGGHDGWPGFTCFDCGGLGALTA